MDVLLVDFRDSFTFNIVSELRMRGIWPVVKDYEEVSLLDEQYKKIILGPGPGRPTGYGKILEQLREELQRKDSEVRFWGICLGHQFLWHCLGYPISYSSRPLHGVRVSMKVPRWKIFGKAQGRPITVQRYNSLCIQAEGGEDFLAYDENGEVMMGIHERFISYQFHPESIGTGDKNLLFEAGLRFLYNQVNEEKSYTLPGTC